MSPLSFSCSIVLLVVVSANVINCSDLDETIKNLHQLLGTKSQQRFARDSEEVSSIWFDYEFDTGAGNREEVVVKNISVHENPKLPENGTAWQYLDANGVGFLVHAEPSRLSFHKLDPDNILTDDPAILNVTGVILTYKVLVSDSFQSARTTSKADVVAVLCVESNNGILLQWHRLIDDSSFTFFWWWPIRKRIKSIEYLQYGTKNELLLLDEDELQFHAMYSPISVYSFSIDFSTNSYHYGLRESTLAPKVSGIQVCPIYETMFLVLQGISDVTLYEYRDNTLGNIFQERQTIKSQDLRNFVCFESGYLQFLAVSGPEASLFHFLEGEFQYNTESEANFDISEISWVKDVRLNTYREESLLLIQLRNSTVIALGWQGLSFKRIQLPHNILDQFDLSMATVIPKFGFVLGNKFVKLHTDLKDLEHPSQHTMEKLLTVQRLLNDTLNYQEHILDETEARLEKSYLKNPEVTGFWKIDVLNATNATVSDSVTYHSVFVGSANLTREDLGFNVAAYMEQLNDLEKKLEEIDSYLEQAENLNSTRLDFDSEVFRDVEAAGTLNVDNISVQFVNGIDVLNISPESVIEEPKQFSSIKADNLTIHSLNGVPVTDILFANSIRNYSGVDFSKINQAVVEGNLSFETINDVNWEHLMKNIVWKNRDMVIPGITVIEGSLSADNVEIDTLNDLRYPYDYVFTEDNTEAKVTGSKSFNRLRVGSLNGLKTINGIDVDDFVILHKDNVLNEEITFENLIVEGPLLVDGKVTGPGVRETKLLNETSEIESHVIFSDLTVLGNVIFDKAFFKKRPFSLDDLLLKTDEDAKITGTKRILGNVEMKSNVTITSGSINGHSMVEFVTTDTDQEFPNLRNVSSLVTFGNISYRSIDELENLLNKTGSCLDKIIVFKSPIVVDELSFDTISSHDVPSAEFFNKLNKTFENIVFDSLRSETLTAQEIAPKVINGVDFDNFTAEQASSINTANYSIDYLETDSLDVKFINGMSLDEINDLIGRLNSLLENITSGNMSFDSLMVTGKIDAKLINGVALRDLYKDHKSKVIFKNDLTIRKLTIDGLLNGFNFTDRVMDTVLKSNNDITVDGHKTFNTVRCLELEAVSLNGHPLKNIFDPKKDQLLTGPVIVNGTVTVREKFHATGNIGDVKFQDLMDRRKFLGNNTYEFRESIRFPQNVSIENLVVNGTVQGTDFDSFYKSIIFPTESNLTISGPKVFNNSVTFSNAFVVREQLNDINLKDFWKNAVFIDKPFYISSKVVFEDDIRVEKDLIVKTDFEVESIMGVNINELKLGVLYLNRPVYIEETVELNNVVFQSNIEVEKFNGLDMRLLISLKSEQTIPVQVLKCQNITVEKKNFELLGRINEQNLNTLQKTTFMKTGIQNITGHINFTGPVRVRRNFNARLINGVDPTRIVPLYANRTLTGNFVFEKPMIMKQSLRVLNGYLNGIDPAQWEAAAVKTSNFFKQIVSGKWTVHGNVHFENGTTGSSVLNGTRLDKLADTLGKRHLEMDASIAETNTNLEDICQDLNHLKRAAEKQIYKFSVFDYLQSIELDDRIVSLDHFELNDSDYLMICYHNCHMQTYLFTGEKFELVANVTDFGVVEGSSRFNNNGSLYFFTSGTRGCGRNSQNLWKLENNMFEHVWSLGRKINSRKVDQKVLQAMIDRKNAKRLSKIHSQDDQLMAISGKKAHKHGVGKRKNTDIVRASRNPQILNFKAGIFQKEIFLSYEKDLSDNQIFIGDNNETHEKIIQTIEAHRPTSFAVLNFEGDVETLLLFVENRRVLRIYEYKGVQGFVYRDSISMNIDKLFNFRIQKYPGFAKRHCLALIHGNRLRILEAKMYGEKVDMEPLQCSGV